MNPHLDASALLLDAVQRHKIHLSLLVADTGLWVNPNFHTRLLRDTGSVAVFPHVRRARIGQGEKRSQVVNGIRFDDNTYANVAIKRAAGLGKSAIGFEACHIWPLTCYDERYHTAVANLVLLPRALAGLSDHDAEIQRALQYRALELYGWWPEEFAKPIKPDFYPPSWRSPQTDIAMQSQPIKSPTDKLAKEKHRDLNERLVGWSAKPNLNVHKIIALVVQAPSGVSRNDLVNRVAEVTQSKDPYGAIASLLTDAGNAYGRVLIDDDGIIGIHPEFAAKVQTLVWSIAG